VELPHCQQDAFPEAFSKPGGQVLGQPTQQSLPVLCPLLASLLVVHNPAAYFPVLCKHAGTGSKAVLRLSSDDNVMKFNA
jgi:hypothetical protein